RHVHHHAAAQDHHDARRRHDGRHHYDGHRHYDGRDRGNHRPLHHAVPYRQMSGQRLATSRASHTLLLYISTPSHRFSHRSSVPLPVHNRYPPGTCATESDRPCIVRYAPFQHHPIDRNT